MPDGAFQRRVKALADGAGLRIHGLGPSRATLRFQVDRVQTLFVFPFGDVWEFSCPSVVTVEDTDDIPAAALLAALRLNARNKRGFWCVEKIDGRETLEYMHNVPERLLEAEEFGEVCWALVHAVSAFEEACQDVLEADVPEELVVNVSWPCQPEGVDSFSYNVDSGRLEVVAHFRGDGLYVDPATVRFSRGPIPTAEQAEQADHHGQAEPPGQRAKRLMVSVPGEGVGRVKVVLESGYLTLRFFPTSGATLIFGEDDVRVTADADADAEGAAIDEDAEKSAGEASSAGPAALPGSPRQG